MILIIITKGEGRFQISKMLDKKVFKEKMQDLVDFYPSWKLDITEKAIVKKWYKKFEKYDNENFKEAVDKYIENEEFAPTIAGIKKYIQYIPEDTFTQEEVKEFVQRNLQKS